MKPKIGNKALIVKNSRPDTPLWDRKGEMNLTIGKIGVIREIAAGDPTFKIVFEDESLNGTSDGWWYWESDFELIFSETTINY